MEALENNEYQLIIDLESEGKRKGPARFAGPCDSRGSEGGN